MAKMMKKGVFLLALTGIACAISSFNPHPGWPSRERAPVSPEQGLPSPERGSLSPDWVPVLGDTPRLSGQPGDSSIDPSHPSAVTAHHASQKTVLRTIIIDPGHGGFDPGTVGLISKEKEVTLAIGLKLGKAIQEAFPNTKIVFTRTTDVMPGNASTIHEGLVYRADLANKEKGDLFLSIHANANDHPPGHYEVKTVVGHKWVKKGSRKRKVPIYESHWVKNTAIGAKCLVWKAMWGEYKGSVINEQMAGEENMGDSTAPAIDMSSPENRVRAMLYEKKYFANSISFAEYMQSEFEKAGRKNLGVEQREVGIWVLEATGMPSVLIETGYLSNEEEEKFLNSEEGQDQVVQNIVDALRNYRDMIEGRKNTPAPDTSNLVH